MKPGGIHLGASRPEPGAGSIPPCRLLAPTDFGTLGRPPDTFALRRIELAAPENASHERLRWNRRR